MAGSAGCASTPLTYPLLSLFFQTVSIPVSSTTLKAPEDFLLGRVPLFRFLLVINTTVYRALHFLFTLASTLSRSPPKAGVENRSPARPGNAEPAHTQGGFVLPPETTAESDRHTGKLLGGSSRHNRYFAANLRCPASVPTPCRRRFPQLPLPRRAAARATPRSRYGHRSRATPAEDGEARPALRRSGAGHVGLGAGPDCSRGSKCRSRGAQGAVASGGVAVTQWRLGAQDSSRATPLARLARDGGVEGWSPPRHLSPQHGCARGAREVLATG